MPFSWQVRLCLGPYGLREPCRLCLNVRRWLFKWIGWNSVLQRFERDAT
jgi:hypothetical protein